MSTPPGTTSRSVPSVAPAPQPPAGHHVFTPAELAVLDPVHRLLLTSDGTVTFILEAFTGEPVQAEKLQQTMAQQSACQLEVDDELLLSRQVILRGTVSGRALLHGDSLIALQRLDPAVQDGLLSTSTPIGRLLAASRIETFREIVSVGSHAAGPVYGAHFDVDPTATILTRTYRIIARERPIMVITERFPASGWHRSAIA